LDAGAVHDYFSALQERIVSALEVVDRKGFTRDSWQRAEGGGGTTCIVEGGQVFERGGVNLSRVQGRNLPPSASAARPQLAGRSFEAMGVSLVLHPRNPYCPTVHLNVRFFSTQGENPVWWFGGGMDLTPYYGFEEDARHFHATCRKALIPFGADLHPKFKRWCDEYFHLRHRNEPRGIGGIFYDRYNTGDWETDFAFTQSVGKHFADVYPQIVKRRMAESWSDAEREEQLVRRGRYVEFNLLYDRGTTFGLKTGGNVESILSSMPPMVKWP
jgi:coproporphyrinogen III oxidase